MTVTIYDDPGLNEEGTGYVSERYSATVNGSAATVLASVNEMEFTHPGGDGPLIGEEVEVSFLQFATDEEVDVVVTLLTEPGAAGEVAISSVIVFPEALSIPHSFTAGATTVTITLQPGQMCWLLVNGDRYRMLKILAREPVTLPAHDVVWSTENSCPADTVMRFPAGVCEIGLQFTVGEGATLVIPGGTLLRGTLSWPDTRNITVIGHGTVSGDLLHTTTLREDQATHATRAPFSLIYGNGASSGTTVTGIVLMNPPYYATHFGVEKYVDVTVISPWYANMQGLWPWAETGRTAEVIDCSAYSQDDCVNLSEFIGAITVRGGLFAGMHNSTFIGGYWPQASRGLATVAGNYILALQTWHQTVNQDGTPTTSPHPGLGSIFQWWCDGAEGEEDLVVADYLIENNYIEGGGYPIRARIFDASHVRYPYTSADSGDPGIQVGQIKNITVRGLYVQSVPTFKSRVFGKDATNTPHDLTFIDVYFGSTSFTSATGTRLSLANFPQYFERNEFPYALFFDVPIPPDGGTGLGQGSVGGHGGSGEDPDDPVDPDNPTEPDVESSAALWAAVVGSYEAAGLVTLTNIRDPDQTVINDTMGADAAQEVIDLWPAYAQSEFDLSNRLHVAVAKHWVIALLWERGGTSQQIAKLEVDKVIGDGGMIEKVRRTGPRGKQAPMSNSGVQVRSELSHGRAVLGWSDRDALPHGVLPRRRLFRE